MSLWLVLCPLKAVATKRAAAPSHTVPGDCAAQKEAGPAGNKNVSYSKNTLVAIFSIHCVTPLSWSSCHSAACSISHQSLSTSDSQSREICGACSAGEVYIIIVEQECIKPRGKDHVTRTFAAKPGKIQQEYILCTLEWRNSIPVRIVYT